MIAKVYSCLGPIYIKIAEEKCDDMDKVISDWKYACLIEFFDEEGNLVESIDPKEL
ncbi:hypothetical protein AB1303_01305 [Saccharolobus solfataricus]|uniref:Uncharacterized protein n=1 Tax=Saccharolobus solfataricus TaxID=2287 RepID=A0A7S9IH05_SACSO|nr:hypothetical protein [Saccharolobus solfataricus]QPG48966.1 hypothetical protein HFC64_02645 [Saccharolobus solfataricus]